MFVCFRCVLQLFSVFVVVLRVGIRVLDTVMEAARGTSGTSSSVGVGCPAKEMLRAVCRWWVPVHEIEAWEGRVMSSSDRLSQEIGLGSGCTVTSY